MKSYSKVSLIIQLVLVSIFLLFLCKADQEMDKSGVGNLQAWEQFNAYASIAIYSAVIVWLFIIILTSIKGSFSDNHAQFSVGLPPLFLILGWVSHGLCSFA